VACYNTPFFFKLLSTHDMNIFLHQVHAQHVSPHRCLSAVATEQDTEPQALKEAGIRTNHLCTQSIVQVHLKLAGCLLNKVEEKTFLG